MPKFVQCHCQPGAPRKVSVPFSKRPPRYRSNFPKIIWKRPVYPDFLFLWLWWHWFSCKELKALYLLLHLTVPPEVFLEFNYRYHYILFCFNWFHQVCRVLCFYIMVYDIKHMKKNETFHVFFLDDCKKVDLSRFDLVELRFFRCWNQIMTVPRISLSLFQCHCAILQLNTF